MPGMGLNFGDLDNDGWLDFYVGTGNPDFSTLVPNRMFRNDGGKRFQDVTTAGNFGHLQKGHGIAFGDVDNDGDQDIFEKMGGAYQSDRACSVLFENPGTPGNKWISLSLEGTKANRGAIGARVKVVAQTAAGPRAIYRTVGPGASFGSQTLRQHIGLGRATAVTSVEVRWPGSDVIQTFRGFKPGEHYRLREGTAAPIVEPLPRFTLSHERCRASTRTATKLRRGLALALAGSLVVGLAAQREPPKRAVSWDRARAEIARYRATLDSSGLVDVDACISPRVDAEDLQALCQARREAVTLGRATVQNALTALPRGRRSDHR